MGRLTDFAVKAAKAAAEAAKKRAAGAAERVTSKAPKPKATSKPLRVKTPDEGDWELPNLDEEIAVYTAPVERTTRLAPAQAAPAREKLTVYHGTPHRLKPELKVRNIKTGEESFIEGQEGDRVRDIPASVEPLKEYPLGRFRMDKIGTGEGAQMYGHGLYFAEHPDVARKYRNTRMPWFKTGNPTIGGQDVDRFYIDLERKADQLPSLQAQTVYNKLAVLDDLINEGDTLGISQLIEKDPGRYSPEAIDWYKRDVAPRWNAPGALYEVGLDVDPAKMLAWDQSVMEQPEVMRSIAPLLQKYQIEGIDNGKYPTLGGDLYHQLRLRSDVRDTAMADLLAGAGVPGIRYLDQGSRAAGTGTENYVMMNPDLIEIMKRYNMGGAVQEGEY